MIFDIRNKVIIVTGSNSGIGKLISKFLLEYGAKVIRIDKRFSNASKKKLLKSNPLSFDIKLDLSEVKKIPLNLKFIQKKFKKIDGLINCHGITKEIRNNKKFVIVIIINIYYLKIKVFI